MHPKISLKGIDEAIRNFPRTRKENLKYKLITTIRKYYQTDSDIKKIKSIPAEDLIKTLWGTGDDPVKIKEKKKNFSNLKSSLNRDLRDMFNNGKNPEGIKVGRTNVFVMSDKMKDQIIKKFDLGIKSIEVRVPDGDEEQKKIELDEEYKPDERWMEEQIREESKQKYEQDDLLQEITDPAAKELIKEKLRELIKTIKAEKFVWDADDLAQEIDNLIGSLKDDTEKKEREKEEKKEEDLQEIIESTGNELIDQKLKELLEKIKDEKLLVEPEDIAKELENIIKSIESDSKHPEEKDKEDSDQQPDKSEGGDTAQKEQEQKNEEDDLLQEITDPAAKELIKEKLRELIKTIKAEKFVWDADDLAQEIDNLIGSLKDDTEKKEREKEEKKEEDLQEIIESTGNELIDQKLKELLEKIKDEKLLVEPEDITKELENIIKSIESDSEHPEKKGEENSDQQSDKSDNECNVKEELFDTQVLIPKGVYIVGNKDFKRDEQPEKRVELDAFYIDQYPVTNAQFMIFVKETGYKTSAERRGSGEVCIGKYQRIEDPKTSLTTLKYNNGNTFKTVEGACWMHPFGPGSSIQEKLDHPVVQISLEDALEFAQWAGKRLITEFEWEAAARGSDGRLFPWGTDWEAESCNHDESTISDTTPVNQYDELGKSPLDVYDMIGNIFEWTSTPYHDPFTNNAPNNYYVIKGGSWATKGVLTAAKRLMKHAQSWSNTIGFRCAKDSTS